MGPNPTPFSFLVALLLASPLVSATCYWQNSTLAPDSPYSIAPDDTACFPDQENSPCCGTGWTCLSDGVCFIQQGSNDFYYRGTCTDRTWDSQQCPGWCFAQNSNTSIPLAKCTLASGEDWYCCPGDDNCNCNTGVDVVKLGASQPTTVTVIGSTSWPGFTSTSSGFSTSAFATAGTSTNTNTLSTSSGTTSSSSSSSYPSTSTRTGSNTSTKTGTASAYPTAASGQNAAVASKSSSNKGLAAGLGAGLGVAGLAIIAALLYFLLRRRRRNKKNASAEQEAKLFPASYPSSHLGEMAGSSPGTGSAYEAAGQKSSVRYYASPELPGDAASSRNEVAGDVPWNELHGGEYQRPETGARAEMQG